VDWGKDKASMDLELQLGDNLHQDCPAILDFPDPTSNIFKRPDMMQIRHEGISE
jgi:hypothetical protein